MNPSNYDVGRNAEKLVEDALRKQQWQILATNYRGRGFEIDIIARKQTSLIGVEVKSRAWAEPTCDDVADLMSAKKSARIQLGLDQFIAKHSQETHGVAKLRIDLAIVKPSSKPYIVYFADAGAGPY